MSIRQVIDLSELYSETAKLSCLDEYRQKAIEQGGEGSEVVLTGAAPVWLYLAIAHELHGKVRKLFYRSPALEKDLLIFDHDPY